MQDDMLARFFGSPTKTTICGDADVGLGVHAVGEVVKARGGLNHSAKCFPGEFDEGLGFLCVGAWVEGFGDEVPGGVEPGIAPLLPEVGLDLVRELGFGGRYVGCDPREASSQFGGFISEFISQVPDVGLDPVDRDLVFGGELIESFDGVQGKRRIDFSAIQGLDSSLTIDIEVDVKV